MAEHLSGGFPNNPGQYAGKVDVGSGPVQLGRWRRERSQHEAEALGRSVSNNDLRPEVKTGRNPKREERRH